MPGLSTTRASRFIRKSPIFYGWIVLVVAIVAVVLPFAGHNATLSLFIDDFITEFHLDRTAISTLFGVGSFIAALIWPWVGRAVDRFGSRLVTLIGGWLFALSLIGLSLAGSPLVLLVLFIAMRGVGVGPLTITGSTVVAQWFRSRRGRVMGIMVIFTWLSQGIYVPWAQQILETIHWRQFWQIEGVVIGLLIVPGIWLLMRDRPEDFGLLPDGAAQADDETASVLATEDNWTLKEAQRTAIFWIFVLGRMMLPAIGSSLMLHQSSMFGVLGYEPHVSAQVLGAASLIAAGLSFFTGYLVDRLRPGLVMMVQLSTMSLTMILAMTSTVEWMLPLYALAFGTSISVGAVFDNTVWANLFGRDHLGEIRGFVATATAIGGAVGPILFGWSFDTLGTYNVMFGVFIALCLGQMVLAYLAPPPRRDVQPGIAMRPAVGD